MNRFAPLTIVAAVLFGLPLVALASAEDAFNDGNVAYEAGMYQEAHHLYQSMVDDGQVAAGLFYNLGNAAYRLDRDGEAALWYRRAIAIDPIHAEARQNLRVIENKTGFIQPVSNSTQRFLDHFSHRQLVILLSFAFWGTVLSFLTLLLATTPSPLGRGKIALIAARVLSLVLLTFCAVVMGLQSQRRPIDTSAVVVSDNAVARTSPYTDAKDVIALPPGSQLVRLEDRGPWAYVGIGDDIRGWLRAEEIASLWPYEKSLLE
jgi:tetratricopeptide (TPR) repeat protein